MGFGVSFGRPVRPIGIPSLQEVQDIASGITGAGGVGLVSSFDSLAALKATTAVPDTKVVILKGTDAPGDAPPRTLIYDAASTAPADDVSVIAAPALPGRFLSRERDRINWATFGADPTGVEDSTLAIRAAIQWAYAVGVPSIAPAGTFLVTGWLLDFDRVRDGGNPNISIFGVEDGITTINLVGPIPDYVFRAYGPTDAYNGQSQLSNLNFERLFFSGDGVSIQRVFDLAAVSYFSFRKVRTFRCRGTNLRLRQAWEGYLDLKMVRGGQVPRLAITGTIAAGQIITGQTSGATAWVIRTGAGFLELTGISGEFAGGETITGSVDGTAVAGPLTGEEEYVAHVDHLFLDSNGQAEPSNNLEFPKGFQIEAPEGRALYLGPNTRKITASGSKFHYRIGSAYSPGTPAIVCDGTNRNLFTGLNMAWGQQVASIRVERTRPDISGPCNENAFIGNSVTGGFEFRGHCLRNVVVGNSGNVAPGRAAFVTFDGGLDNEVSGNTVTGGPEVAWTGTAQVRARGGAVRVQSGVEPAGGWNNLVQIHASAAANTVALIESTTPNAYTAHRDSATTTAPRHGARGNSYIVQVSDTDALLIEDIGRISFVTPGGVVRFRSPAGTYYPMGVYDNGQPHFGNVPLGVKVPVPAAPNAPGIPGQWAADATHAYFCATPNTWRRVALATW